MADEVGVPWQQGVRLRAPFEVGLRHRRAEPALVAFEPGQAVRPLGHVERREGKQKAVMSVALDLRVCQRLHVILRKRGSVATDGKVGSGRHSTPAHCCGHCLRRDPMLSDQQTTIRDMARDFARREITPFAADWDRREHVPLETLGKMGALGLMGVCVPQQWGGSGADFVSYVLAMEEIAYGDAGVANMMAATNFPYNAAVLAHGTDAQKEKFLRPAAVGPRARRLPAERAAGRLRRRQPRDARRAARRPLRDRRHEEFHHLGPDRQAWR